MVQHAEPQGCCVWPCAGLALLGQIDEKFVEVVDVMEPLASGSQDRAFISRGYDATSHFETTVRPGGHPNPSPASCPSRSMALTLITWFLVRDAPGECGCSGRTAWRS